MPAARCSGASAVIGTIVVQLGHDTIPRGMSRTSSGLTSATTSGTSASMRNAAELSTTRAPLSAARGAHSSASGSSTSITTRSRPSKQPSRKHLAHDLAAGERQPAAFRAGRRVDAQLVDRERALFEQPQHLGADEAGRADDTDRTGRRSRVSSSNDACSACTARSTSSSCTTHEMRIVDVEIISMLTLSAASVSNICAATPGFVFIPAPTSDTRPMRVVEVRATGVDLHDHLVDDLHRARRARPSGW